MDKNNGKFHNFDIIVRRDNGAILARGVLNRQAAECSYQEALRSLELVQDNLGEHSNDTLAIWNGATVVHIRRGLLDQCIVEYTVVCEDDMQ